MQSYAVTVLFFDDSSKPRFKECLFIFSKDQTAAEIEIKKYLKKNGYLLDEEYAINIIPMEEDVVWHGQSEHISNIE